MTKRKRTNNDRLTPTSLKTGRGTSGTCRVNLVRWMRRGPWSA